MLFHEDFLRCPNCDSAWFRKNVFVQLDKKAFASKDENLKIKETLTKTEYICEECGKSFYIDVTK